MTTAPWERRTEEALSTTSPPSFWTQKDTGLQLESVYQSGLDQTAAWGEEEQGVREDRESALRSAPMVASPEVLLLLRVQKSVLQKNALQKNVRQKTTRVLLHKPLPNLCQTLWPRERIRASYASPLSP